MKESLTRILIGSAIAATLLLLVVFGPLVFQAYREKVRRQQAVDSFRQIQRAMEEYQQRQGDSQPAGQ